MSQVRAVRYANGAICQGDNGSMIVAPGTSVSQVLTLKRNAQVRAATAQQEVARYDSALDLIMDEEEGTE